MSVQQEPTVPVVTPSQAIHIGTNALLALLEQEVASAASAFARQNASDTESSAARFKEYREATQASQDSMRSQIDAQKQTISLLRADIERVKNQETDAFNAMRHDLTRSKIIFETLGVVPSSEADSNAFTFAREALNVFASLELPSGTATEQPVDESYWANVTSNTLIPTLRRISEDNRTKRGDLLNQLAGEQTRAAELSSQLEESTKSLTELQEKHESLLQAFGEERRSATEQQDQLHEHVGSSQDKVAELTAALTAETSARQNLERQLSSYNTIVHEKSELASQVTRLKQEVSAGKSANAKIAIESANQSNIHKGLATQVADLSKQLVACREDKKGLEADLITEKSTTSTQTEKIAKLRKKIKTLAATVDVDKKTSNPAREHNPKSEGSSKQKNPNPSPSASPILVSPSPPPNRPGIYRKSTDDSLEDSPAPVKRQRTTAEKTREGGGTKEQRTATHTASTSMQSHRPKHRPASGSTSNINRPSSSSEATPSGRHPPEIHVVSDSDDGVPPTQPKKKRKIITPADASRR